MIDTGALIDKHGIISDQVDRPELEAILQELNEVLSVDGAIVEFGCYRGTTSLFIQRLLDLHKDQRELHVYDSFVGLPEKAPQDISPLGEQFKAGELSVSKKEYILNFRKAGLKLPTIHKGWFDELKPDDLPDEIAFAFLDGDYYESIMVPLELVKGRLTNGAVVVVDDYGNQALPGARLAVDEWCDRHGLTVREKSSLAVIRTG